MTSADASASVSVASTFGAVGSGGRHRGGSGHKRLAVRMQPVVLQKYRAIGLPEILWWVPMPTTRAAKERGGGGVEYTRRLRVRVQDLGTGVAVSGVVEELKLPSKNIVDEQEEEEDDNSNGVFNVKALVEKTIIQDAIEGAIKSVTWDERGKKRPSPPLRPPPLPPPLPPPMLDAVYEEGTASSSLSSPSSSSSSSLRPHQSSRENRITVPTPIITMTRLIVWLVERPVRWHGGRTYCVRATHRWCPPCR